MHGGYNVKKFESVSNVDWIHTTAVVVVVMVVMMMMMMMMMMIKTKDTVNHN
jgi:hypothetical protein